MSRYLIIGSGLIGRLTAWRLMVDGHQVSILSKDDKQGTDSAGFVAASMVAPATEAISAEPMVKTLGLRSYALWPQWLKQLPEPVFYRDHGTLVVAHAGDESEMARYQRRASHLLEDSDFRLLDHQALTNREPELADNFRQAMWFEQESCLDNRQLYRQLGELLQAHCNWQQTGDIGELNQAEIDRLCQQYLNCRADQFDEVIDCRGNGGKTNLSNLRSVRGEVIRVQAPEVNFKHAVRLMHPRYPFYLAPRPGNEYVLGATVIESDDRSAVTVRSGLELMSALYSLHKGFAEARIIEMTAHCRPGLPDNMPTIKRTDWGYIVNGFYRHGYLFGPAVVQDLTRLLAGQPEQVDFGELYELTTTDSI
jgi:glycine oxidase